MVSKADKSFRPYRFLIDHSIRRRVKVNSGGCNSVGVPGNTTISGHERRFSNVIEFHDIGKLRVGLTQRNCEVGDI
jgi:hypothetical protein